MIFHHTQPIVTGGLSGSQVKPYYLEQAFKDIGYDVISLADYSSKRFQIIKKIKQEVKKGLKIDFLYSESTPVPTALNDKHHFPLHPFLDFQFFQFLRKRNIPVGLFYCDIYWKFDHYKKNIVLYKRLILSPFHIYDWLQYCRTLDILFVPSRGMQEHLPRGFKREIQLAAPGCLLYKIEKKQADLSKQLNLLYIGGITPPVYDLSNLVQVINKLDNVKLTLCCRQAEWSSFKDYYSHLDKNKVHIVHKSGDALLNLYKQADAFVIYRPSHVYTNFMMPVKLFEALGHGLPVISNSCTEVAAFIQEHDTGFVVKDESEFINLIKDFQCNPQTLEAKIEKTITIRKEHTWEKRAQAIATALLKIKN